MGKKEKFRIVHKSKRVQLSECRNQVRRPILWGLRGAARLAEASLCYLLCFLLTDPYLSDEVADIGQNASCCQVDLPVCGLDEFLIQS